MNHPTNYSLRAHHKVSKESKCSKCSKDSGPHVAESIHASEFFIIENKHGKHREHEEHEEHVANEYDLIASNEIHAEDESDSLMSSELGDSIRELGFAPLDVDDLLSDCFNSEMKETKEKRTPR